jgi:signal transduction histidine kinase
VTPEARVGRLGLSARLLLLGAAFVVLAVALVAVPSVASFRQAWLTDRIAAAQVAALVLDAAPDQRLSEDLANRLLAGVGARAIAVRGGGTSRLLSGSDMPPEIGRTVDLRSVGWGRLIWGAAATLFAPADKPMRVVGPGSGPDELVEAILDERPLRRAMLAHGRAILLVSLALSAATAGLLFLVLEWIIVRPVRRIAQNMAAFAGDPQDATKVIAPSRRTDEIGLAETALARMEAALAGELRQSRRLAEIGLAVSKVNHELRNLLTTAQLLGDRLEDVPDPGVQRVAPRLVATLARAIRFCEATLAYGRAAERQPERARVPLAGIVAEILDLGRLAPGDGVAVEDCTPPELIVDADPEQLGRVLGNLVRNAVQALHLAGPASGEPARVTLDAERAGAPEGGTVTILVADNGPGLPERARAHLFEPFKGSARSGGTGLGLVVAAELVRLHGGTLTLDATETGARFRIVIPDRDRTKSV